MDIGNGYALNLTIKATGEYKEFDSQEEFNEYIRENNLQDGEYDKGFIIYEIYTPFPEEIKLNEQSITKEWR